MGEPAENTLITIPPAPGPKRLLAAGGRIAPPQAAPPDARADPIPPVPLPPPAAVGEGGQGGEGSVGGHSVFNWIARMAAVTNNAIPTASARATARRAPGPVVRAAITINPKPSPPSAEIMVC